MFKTQDFEKLWYRYKSEGEPNSLSIERYCMMQGVPYPQFEKWFRSTRKDIIPIQVDGAPICATAPGFRRAASSSPRRCARCSTACAMS